nr:hypothetical protein CFP56_16889 [Quercus suber]
MRHLSSLDRVRGRPRRTASQTAAPTSPFQLALQHDLIPGFRGHDMWDEKGQNAGEDEGAPIPISAAVFIQGCASTADGAPKAAEMSFTPDNLAGRQCSLGISRMPSMERDHKVIASCPGKASMPVPRDERIRFDTAMLSVMNVHVPVQF